MTMEMAIAVDRLCRFIDANLDHPLDLGLLERTSGLSARTLQLQFRQQFGCTPLQWVRTRRLERARQRLQEGHGEDSIIEIALSCGFNHPSMFSAYYRQRFGELPSATLRQARCKEQAVPARPAATVIVWTYG